VTVDPARRPFQSFNVAGGDHGSRTPGDRFGAGRYERDGRIEFAFEAMARADLPAETLRLNGHLPLAGNAGSPKRLTIRVNGILASGECEARGPTRQAPEWLTAAFPILDRPPDCGQGEDA